MLCFNRQLLVSHLFKHFLRNCLFNVFYRSHFFLSFWRWTSWDIRWQNWNSFFNLFIQFKWRDMNCFLVTKVKEAIPLLFLLLTFIRIINDIFLFNILNAVILIRHVGSVIEANISISSSEHIFKIVHILGCILMHKRSLFHLSLSKIF